ncbi:MAG: AmmeMemoRadiSam system protein A [Alphaproteobacteria bacterium]
MSADIELKYQELAKQYNRFIIDLARKSIDYSLEKGGAFRADLKNMPPELQEKGSCFVTLEQDNNLRGCIGSIIAYRPLAEDIVDNAYAAAFRDTRFSKITKNEFQNTELSVSLLTPFQEMTFSDEDDLLEQLRPGIDGVIIEDMGRRAVFLPVVWEYFDKKEDFMMHLKVKAGLSAKHFSNSFRASRFLSVCVKQEH